MARHWPSCYTRVVPETKIDGQKLFYTYQKGRSTPEEGGPEAVLLHGAGGTHLDWPASLRRLSAADVYAIDLPGHGRSEPPGRDRIEEYAAAILHFLEDVGAKDIVLIGHSMGGAIAQEVALQHGERLMGLVLMSTGARLRVAEAILRGLRDSPEEAMDTLLEGYWLANAPESVRERTRRQLREVDSDVIYGDFVACDHFDRMARVQEIDVPTLVISGTADRMTPLKYGRYLAEQIEGAQLKIVEGGSHLMALHEPLEVGAYVEEFIIRLSGRRDRRAAPA